MGSVSQFLHYRCAGGIIPRARGKSFVGSAARHFPDRHDGAVPGAEGAWGSTGGGRLCCVHPVFYSSAVRTAGAADRFFHCFFSCADALLCADISEVPVRPGYNGIFRLFLCGGHALLCVAAAGGRRRSLSGLDGFYRFLGFGHLRLSDRQEVRET